MHLARQRAGKATPALGSKTFGKLLDKLTQTCVVCGITNDQVTVYALHTRWMVVVVAVAVVSSSEFERDLPPTAPSCASSLSHHPHSLHTQLSEEGKPCIMKCSKCTRACLACLLTWHLVWKLALLTPPPHLIPPPPASLHPPYPTTALPLNGPRQISVLLRTRLPND